MFRRLPDQDVYEVSVVNAEGEAVVGWIPGDEFRRFHGELTRLADPEQHPPWVTLTVDPDR